MSEAETIEAVALLRIPEWDAPDEVDVRFLDDGALVFLPIAFDSDPEDLVEALVEAVGEAGDGHDDARGVFFFPDAAEPDDATTYEAVIAAVGADGTWIQVDGPEPDFGASVQSLLGQAFEAMGISDPGAFMNAMQGGDPEAAKLAQIQLQGRLEQRMKAEFDSEPPVPPKPDDDPKR